MCLCVRDLIKNVKKKNYYVFGSLNMFGFDDNGSNSGQELSPDEQTNDSSDNFSPKEPSKKSENGSACGVV